MIKPPIHKGLNDPMNGHRCKKFAQIVPIGPNREAWVGKLLEPIVEHEVETHCFHIKTPARDVVFGIIPEDFYALSALAEALHGKPINPRWLTNAARKYKNVVFSEETS